MSPVIDSQRLLARQCIVGSLHHIRSASRILQPHAHLCWYLASGCLIHGVEVAQRVENASLAHWNRIHKVSNFLERVTIDCLCQRVVNRAQKRHVGTDRFDHWRMCAEPDRHPAPLAHSHRANSLLVNLNLRLQHSRRNHRVLNHSPKNKGVGIRRSFREVAPRGRVLFLVKRVVAVQVDAQTHQSFPSPVFVGQQTLPSIGRNPQKPWQPPRPLGISNPAVNPVTHPLKGKGFNNEAWPIAIVGHASVIIQPNGIGFRHRLGPEFVKILGNVGR